MRSLHAPAAVTAPFATEPGRGQPLSAHGFSLSSGLTTVTARFRPADKLLLASSKHSDYTVTTWLEDRGSTANACRAA
jgi:hypothetical protein